MFFLNKLNFLETKLIKRKNQSCFFLSPFSFSPFSLKGGRSTRFYVAKQEVFFFFPLRPSLQSKRGKKQGERDQKNVSKKLLSLKTSQKYYWNQTFDKGRLKNFVLWFFLKYGEHKTVQLVEELKTIGFQYATKAGISLGIEDLKIPEKKSLLLLEAENLSLSTIKQFKRGEITEVERFQRLIDTWHRTSERLKVEVIENFEETDVLNPVYMMAFSGARGNISQVRQLVGMRGLMSNPQGQIIDFPIRSNFREGLTLTEYIISSYGARKGIVDTALRTANAGYLTRRLVDVAQHVIISRTDCRTTRGIFLTDMKEGNKIIYSLQNRLIGRVLARDLYKNQQKIASKNSEISGELATVIAMNYKKVFVRSPLTCQTNKLVCQLCYGWSLAQGNLVSIGEAVGVVAAQSIGEPGTQLTMRTFHTGGVFSGNVSDQIKAPFDGIVIYKNPIAGKLIRTPEGKIAFLTKTEGSFSVYNWDQIFSSHPSSPHSQSLLFPYNGTGIGTGGTGDKEKKSEPLLPSVNIPENLLGSVDKKNFKIPFYTLLFLRNREKVFNKQVIAQISSINRQKTATDQAELTIKAEICGLFYSKNLEIEESKIGPVLKDDLDDTEGPHPILDTINRAWNWGYAWILSGKIYQLPLSSSFFPIFGDFVNQKTYMNSIKWNIPRTFGSSFKLNIPLNLNIFNQNNIKKMRKGLPLPSFDDMLTKKDLKLLKMNLISFESTKIIYKKIGYFFKLSQPSSSFSFFKNDILSILSLNDHLFLFSSIFSKKRFFFDVTDSLKTEKSQKITECSMDGFVGTPSGLIGNSNDNKNLINPSNWKPSFNLFLNWFPKRFLTQTGGLIFTESISFSQTIDCSKIKNSKILSKNLNSFTFSFSLKNSMSYKNTTLQSDIFLSSFNSNKNTSIFAKKSQKKNLQNLDITEFFHKKTNLDTKDLVDFGPDLKFKINGQKKVNNLFEHKKIGFGESRGEKVTILTFPTFLKKDSLAIPTTTTVSTSSSNSVFFKIPSSGAKKTNLLGNSNNTQKKIPIGFAWKNNLKFNWGAKTHLTKDDFFHSKLNKTKYLKQVLIPKSFEDFTSKPQNEFNKKLIILKRIFWISQPFFQIKKKKKPIFLNTKQLIQGFFTLAKQPPCFSPSPFRGFFEAKQPPSPKGEGEGGKGGKKNPFRGSFANGKEQKKGFKNKRNLFLKPNLGQSLLQINRQGNLQNYNLGKEKEGSIQITSSFPTHLINIKKLCFNLSDSQSHLSLENSNSLRNPNKKLDLAASPCFAKKKPKGFFFFPLWGKKQEGQGKIKFSKKHYLYLSKQILAPVFARIPMQCGQDHFLPAKPEGQKMKKLKNRKKIIQNSLLFSFLFPSLAMLPRDSGEKKKKYFTSNIKKTPNSSPILLNLKSFSKITSSPYLLTKRTLLNKNLINLFLDKTNKMEVPNLFNFYFYSIFFPFLLKVKKPVFSSSKKVGHKKSIKVTTRRSVKNKNLVPLQEICSPYLKNEFSIYPKQLRQKLKRQKRLDLFFVLKNHYNFHLFYQQGFYYYTLTENLNLLNQKNDVLNRQQFSFTNSNSIFNSISINKLIQFNEPLFQRFRNLKNWFKKTNILKQTYMKKHFKKIFLSPIPLRSTPLFPPHLKVRDVLLPPHLKVKGEKGKKNPLRLKASSSPISHPPLGEGGQAKKQGEGEAESKRNFPNSSLSSIKGPLTLSYQSYPFYMFSGIKNNNKMKKNKASHFLTKQKHSFFLQDSVDNLNQSNLNILVKQGWFYYTKKIANFFLLNKKLIKAGKNIASNFIFDKQNVYIEFIPLNTKAFKKDFCSISLSSKEKKDKGALGKRFNDFHFFKTIKNKNCRFDLSNTKPDLLKTNKKIKNKMEFILLIRKANEFRFFNELEVKKEIYQIATQKNGGPILFSIASFNLFSPIKSKVLARFENQVLFRLLSDREAIKKIGSFSNKKTSLNMKQSKRKQMTSKKALHSSISYSFNSSYSFLHPPVAIPFPPLALQRRAKGEEEPIPIPIPIPIPFRGRGRGRGRARGGGNKGKGLKTASFLREPFRLNYSIKYGLNPFFRIKSIIMQQKFLNKKYNSINLYSYYKTGLLNKQKITSQPISKYQSSHLKLISNTVFYSFLSKLKKTKQQKLFFLSKLNKILNSPRDSFSGLSTFPITSLKSINFFSFILSYKAPYALDFPFKTPMCFFSEQYQPTFLFNIPWYSKVHQQTQKKQKSLLGNQNLKESQSYYLKKMLSNYLSKISQLNTFSFSSLKKSKIQYLSQTPSLLRTAFELSQTLTNLSYFFFSPIVEYSLVKDFPKSITPLSKSDLKNLMIGNSTNSTEKYPISNRNIVWNNINSVSHNKKFLYGMNNPILGSLNQNLYLTNKKIQNKEAVLYKTEFITFINNTVNSQLPFIKTYSYSSFEGELIYRKKTFKKDTYISYASLSEKIYTDLLVLKKTKSSHLLKKNLQKIIQENFTNYFLANKPVDYVDNSCMILTKKDQIAYSFPVKHPSVSPSGGVSLPLRKTNRLGKIWKKGKWIEEDNQGLFSQLQKDLKEKNNFLLEEEFYLKQNYKENFLLLENLKKRNQYVINKVVINVLNILGDSFESTNEKTGDFSNFQSNQVVELNKIPAGLSQQKSQLLIGEFLVYGDKIAPNLAISKGGQIIHINNKKITLRQGQPIFVSPQAILHKYDGDFVDEQSSVITLAYQQLKTGDIVQGIPKIEQFFEARTTKRGRLFRDSLENLLKAIFNRYNSKLSREQAVRQSFYKIQQIIIDGVQRVYRSQGVTIADKHLEVIVKQMTSKVRITFGGSTGYLPGEICDLYDIENLNKELRPKIMYEPIVLGITKASLEVKSFLSAASFQQTTRVLSKAALSRKNDYLNGLKENVILGNLIPAGTGYLVYLDQSNLDLSKIESLKPE
jgi:hypothetical protein